ncbi:MAG TPA: hypothetical protein ENJ27_01905, partial [Candidatus Moranbacteria bacterium]|nr:hypothetical protein [Candidatus Moranbacteria bacterium]
MDEKMLTIVIPKNNIKERKYLLDIVFGQFLKITYNVKVFDNNISEYRIFFNNKKSIIIKDSFFSLYPVSLSYLKKSAIPENVNYILNPLFSEKDLPVFFGEGDIAVEENRIITDIDIFSTIFFMLTRWEEYVSKDKDQHGRFPHTESLAYKYNFIHRPIVNEYIEFLWNMLVLLGCKHKRYKHKFSILLTHDVDHTLRYLNFKMLFVRLAGDIV